MARAKSAFKCETDRELADQVGLTHQAWINRRKAESIPYEGIIQACIEKGVSVEYVLLGKQTVNFINDRSTVYHDNIDEFVEIPHYNVQAAAGHGKIAGDETTLKPLAFRKDWLASRHLAANQLAIVGVSGDSMETHLHDGDLVLVDLSQADIANGKTYVIRLDGHLLVKNLQRLPQGLIQVASFNSGFPPYTVDLADQSIDIAVIGRVVASMHEW